MMKTSSPMSLFVRSVQLRQAPFVALVRRPVALIARSRDRLAG